MALSTRTAMRTRPGDDVAGPGRGTKLAVWLFLVAVLGCGVFEVEAWPLSGFRLFSQVRTGTQVRWQLATVDEEGHEAPADLAAMGRGFRQSLHVLPHLADPATPHAERDAACAGWLAATPQADSLRVYRTVLERSSPADRTAEVTERTLRFTCGRP